MILTHISQLKNVFEKNKDVLTYVELGFFGPWGEMHSSKVSSTENVSKAIDVMLDTVPETIKIGVRTPNYYVKWLGIDRNNLSQNITEKGTSAYRVGLYNDGYLGSESDLGTFANREKEILWLEKQAMHTLYGGEVVANFASGTPLNTIEYMSKEAFRTHTTYLNSEWNDSVIKKWKEETYNGEDELYVGQTGYTYIANHLGYRFVLKKSEIVDKIEANESLRIKLQIENVGFANLINDKKVTIVLGRDDKFFELPTNLDATLWNSKEISDVNIEVQLPENIDLGKWNIYLRISQNGDITEDNNYKCIQFANSNIWEEKIGANYIGYVTISEITEKEDINKEEDVEEEKDETNKEDDVEEGKDETNKEEDAEEEKDETDKEEDVEEGKDETDKEEDVEEGKDETDKEDDVEEGKDETNKEDDAEEGKDEINNKETNSKMSTKLQKDEKLADKLPKTGENKIIIIKMCIILSICSVFVYIFKLKKINKM